MYVLEHVCLPVCLSCRNFIGFIGLALIGASLSKLNGGFFIYITVFRKSNECLHCSCDKQTANLYFSANNMNHGPTNLHTCIPAYKRQQNLELCTRPCDILLLGQACPRMLCICTGYICDYSDASSVSVDRSLLLVVLIYWNWIRALVHCSLYSCLYS